jgi:hypothetical protein
VRRSTNGSLKLTRDGAILAFALAWGTYEIVEGGGRAAVLTFLTGLLLSPIVLRLDEARRNGGDK